MKTLLFFLCLGAPYLYAQSPAESDRTFLTIMVIPYTEKGASVSTTLEENDGCRTVISQINYIFEQRGYRVKDYMALLKLPSIAPSKAEVDRTEVKEAIKNARVDVVIFTEIDWRKFQEGDRQLGLQLKAIDQYSAETYATSVSVASNRRFYQEMVQAVTDHQLLEGLNGYADQLDKKFDNLLANGRSVTIKVSIKPGSKLTFDTVPDGTSKDLGGTIEQWIGQHTARVFSADSDDTYMIVECQLRLMNAARKTVTPYALRTDLKTYLSGLSCSKVPIKAVTGASINSVLEIIIE